MWFIASKDKSSGNQLISFCMGQGGVWQKVHTASENLWDQNVSQISDHIRLWPISQLKLVCYHCAFLLADEDDFHDVISAVTNLAARWQHLGSSLRLRPSVLDTILSASAHSPSDSLRKVLTQWLNQNYNVCITLIYVPPPHTTTYTHTYTYISCFFNYWEFGN